MKITDMFRFAAERLIPVAVEVHRAAEDGAEATVAFARYDPVRHAEGADVKAVTWHAARLERDVLFPKRAPLV